VKADHDAESLPTPPSDPTSTPIANSRSYFFRSK